MSQTATSNIGTAGRVRLKDGRAMTFLSAGPEGGFPVVYCHGAIGSPRWRVRGLDAVLERLSINYLVVNRPGFSGSDPSPGRTVVDFAADLGELMSSLGHRRFSIVGVSAGAPYALACAWALRDRIAALAAVSPLGPPSGSGASPGVRYRVPQILGSPWVGPLVAEGCLRTLRFHRQTSPQAMVEDYRVCRGDWGFDPATVRVPVTLWHGRADRLVPLSHALALADSIATCTPCVDPHGGHFFYSKRLAEIVGTLVPLEAPAILRPVDLALAA